MSVVINGTTGITTPGMSSTGDVTLAGSGVELLNNSGRIVVGQSGSVLQVVNATYGSTTTINNSTMTAVGLSASITPTSASSKILVLMTCNARKQANNTYVQIGIYRGASSILGVVYGGCYTGGTVTSSAGYSGAYLDSPATTSPTTYSLYASSAGNVAAVVFNPDGYDNCTMTLMEIAA